MLFFQRLEGGRGSGPPVFCLFRLCRFSGIACRLCMTFVEMRVKWSVTLTDRLGPEILTVLEIKGQLLHRVRLHVKVPGWLSNLNALLTKKLPKLLSRLNETSGGRENMCLVSGSLRRILKFLRMTFFIASFCGW